MNACLGALQEAFLAHGSSCVDQFSQQEEPRWFALFTMPQNEKAVVRHLSYLGIESFLPTYDVFRVWRNRQRKLQTLPLFPNYVFVLMLRRNRNRVLQIPGVIQIVGRPREPMPLPDAEMEFLRSDFCRKRLQPYPELAVGCKVRVRRGIMQGIQGVLVRKNDRLRLVLTIDLINQQAALEVSAADLEVVHE